MAQRPLRTPSRSVAKLIASGFTATGGLTYGGGYLEVSIVDQTSEETLPFRRLRHPTYDR